ncbi:hypothetical protein D4R30_00540 [archaeon]|nr:MAG: hypothetical protein D4R30_00540 [archaeon]
MSETPQIVTMQVTFAQESDSCEPGDPGQTIEIGVDDAGVGPFLWIKTDRWACDDPAELVALLTKVRDFATAEGKCQ